MFDDKAGMEAVNNALELMLNNEYSKAEAILKPWQVYTQSHPPKYDKVFHSYRADVSPYHSTGYGTILFMRAMMSFDFVSDIDACIQSFHVTCIVYYYILLYTTQTHSM